ISSNLYLDAAEHKYLKEKLQGYKGDPKHRALSIKTIRQLELSINIGGVYLITLGAVTLYAQTVIDNIFNILLM
ncbi:unnamed protein product, partial [Allacma fusca]